MKADRSVMTLGPSRIFDLCLMASFALLGSMLPLHAMAVDTPAVPVTPAATVAPAETKKAAPLEIEADTQLEWIRSQNMYRGTGNVVITRGTSVIRGDMAEAHYDPEKGPSAMTRMQVTGNVTMTDSGRVITGQRADYDAVTEELVVSGDNVTLTTPEMKVTSRKTMTYSAKDKKATATGQAEVLQKNQKLKADHITAFFSQDTNKLERAEAQGNVLMTRQNADKTTDIAQSNSAYYNMTTNMVDLKGRVRLTRGENHMQGDHAIIDLATGHSTMKHTPGSKNGRVRAIFTVGGK